MKRYLWPFVFAFACYAQGVEWLPSAVVVILILLALTLWPEGGASQ